MDGPRLPWPVMVSLNDGLRGLLTIAEAPVTGLIGERRDDVGDLGTDGRVTDQPVVAHHRGRTGRSAHAGSTMAAPV